MKHIEVNTLNDGDVVRFFAIHSSPLIIGTVGTHKGRRCIWSSERSADVGAWPTTDLGAPYPYHAFLVIEVVRRAGPQPPPDPGFQQTIMGRRR